MGRVEGEETQLRALVSAAPGLYGLVRRDFMSELDKAACHLPWSWCVVEADFQDTVDDVMERARCQRAFCLVPIDLRAVYFVDSA